MALRRAVEPTCNRFPLVSRALRTRPCGRKRISPRAEFWGSPVALPREIEPRRVVSTANGHLTGHGRSRQSGRDLPPRGQNSDKLLGRNRRACEPDEALLTGYGIRNDAAGQFCPDRAR